jgi:class 3 adenylate cyclase
MGLDDDLKSEVAKIFRSQWSIGNGQVVPDTSDLKLDNDGVKLTGTVLYADIDGSTTMVDAKTSTFAAEVYKTYLLCASRIINPAIKKQYDTDFQLKQVVGIDTSELLVARTGIRGANDLVWVGKAANQAAKLSSISEQPYAVLISEAINNNMNDSVKFANGTDMWERRTWRGKTVYRSSWYWHVPN